MSNSGRLRGQAWFDSFAYHGVARLAHLRSEGALSESAQPVYPAQFAGLTDQLRIIAPAAGRTLLRHAF
jgi:hypothetical protein